MNVIASLQPSQTARSPITLLLCGDVMLGRGVDQLLAHPSGPALREDYVRDAREYVALAEEVNGPIRRPVGPAYVWGEALRELDRFAPAARIINLETSVTTSEDYWPGKGIHYRMHPSNIDCLKAAKIDACALANNHLLDFGRAGLLETLATLQSAGVRASGAGTDSEEARAPAQVDLKPGRLLLFSMGSETSGIPPEWAAQRKRPGVNLLPDLSPATAGQVVEHLRSLKRPGDIAVASIHWGSNWGYAVPRAQVRFARQLIDGGMDVVHGHSSHHPRPMELYRGKLILYGCGDFINDYEGIRGYEEFRSDLRPMYFAQLEAQTGNLKRLTLVPLEARRLSLHKGSFDDARWLSDILSYASQAFGVRLLPQDDGSLILESAEESTLSP